MAEQLRDLLTDLRAEVGHSTNVAMGINDRDTLIYLLNRTQIRLYENYDWPQLVVDRDTLLAQGQRYYPFPADLSFEDIAKVWLMTNTSTWYGVTYGIGPPELILYDSDANAQSWPVRKWMFNADSAMFEVWPVPDASAPTTGGFIRMRGTKTVKKMINDSDTVTLPGNIVVLFAAAEVLARDDAKDAQMKLALANETMRRHRVRQYSHKSQTVVIGGGGGDAQAPRGNRTGVVGLDFIPPGYGLGP